MWQYILNASGLILNFFGLIVLFRIALKTKGAITPVDEERQIKPIWTWTGYVLLSCGFLCQLIATIITL